LPDHVMSGSALPTILRSAHAGLTAEPLSSRTIDCGPLPTCTHPMERAMPGRNGTETRRSSRVTLRVPLKIFEPGSHKRFLVEEEASALKVSLWGGLIALRAAVNRDQKLFVVNQATGEAAESKVVYLGPMQLGGRRLRLVAIEFLRPSPCFWGMVFPVVDPCRSLNSRHAKAGSSHN
jgi:hypothetical protein